MPDVFLLLTVRRFCVGYGMMLAWLPKIMANRPALVLKWPLVAWNFFLAIFSIVGSYYVLPRAFRSFSNGGFQEFLCTGLEERVKNYVVTFSSIFPFFVVFY